MRLRGAPGSTLSHKKPTGVVGSGVGLAWLGCCCRSEHRHSMGGPAICTAQCCPWRGAVGPADVGRCQCQLRGHCDGDAEEDREGGRLAEDAIACRRTRERRLKGCSPPLYSGLPHGARWPLPPTLSKLRVLVLRSLVLFDCVPCRRAHCCSKSSDCPLLRNQCRRDCAEQCACSCWLGRLPHAGVPARVLGPDGRSCPSYHVLQPLSKAG